MIRLVKFKFGASPSGEVLNLRTPPSVSIFVGPNNSGKSLLLRELYQFCKSGEYDSATLILDGVEFQERDREVARKELSALRIPSKESENVQDGHSFVCIGSQSQKVKDHSFVETLVSPQSYPQKFASQYLRHLTLNLDGKSRISLVNPQSKGDLTEPKSALARLLMDNAKREALRQVIFDAVGMYFAIDALVGDQLQVRFGRLPPADERRFYDSDIEYMKKARSTDEVSDGVKAFTGILIQLRAGDPKVIIVDEPEAFLHPSLAQKLGQEFAKGASTEAKQIFAATHSPQFVMGAILSGAEVNIVRLTHSENVGTARSLPSSELKTLMQDPLLRSVGVISALFYDHVVVVESDADRAFYQEINERLLAAGDSRGVPHTLFLNAQNKDTIPRIVEPLRKLGIPAAAIVDIDIFKEGGQSWTNHLRACGLPETDHQSYGTRRGNILKALNERDSNFKTAGGINILDGDKFNAAKDLCEHVQHYGLFVVQRGEVESWLSELEVPREKRKWLRSIFEKMGSDPSSETYVKPDSGDVWDFLGEVRGWLVDANRRGIPD